MRYSKETKVGVNLKKRIYIGGETLKVLNYNKDNEIDKT